MFPDLIDIGFLHLKTYGACMAGGFILCWWLLEKLSRRKDLGDLLVRLLIAGIIGSRIAYVIEHWKSEFACDPLKIIRIDQGGLMFFGGFILALLIFFHWCYTKKEKTLQISDLMSIILPLGHAFGRIGCFFFGCCYGRDSNAWCAVTFPPGSPSWYEHNRQLVSVLPTQLFEAAALLSLFAALLILRLKSKPGNPSITSRPGLSTGIYMISYAAIRFCIEYLRGDPRAAVGPFSISQTISIALAALGAIFIAYAMKNKTLQEENPSAGQ